MTALWTAAEAVAATDARPRPAAVWRADGVSIDTRSIAVNDIFVALKGPRFDGHEFVATALSDGAAAAMVDRRMPGIDPARLLEVPDTQIGLEKLAIAARARGKARIVAVTGSVGKTGVKEALGKLLSEQAPTHFSAGNLNNQIGLPLSLARMPASAAFGVFELGMNHAGEIAPLSAMLRPHVAIVTTVEAVHLEYFASVEGIADAKAEIFAGMDATGVAILNRDNTHFSRLAAKAREHGVGQILTFGEAEGSDARLLSAVVNADGSAVEASILGRKIAFRLAIPGRHHIQNALAVLLAVAAMGADLDAAAAGFAEIAPVKGRGTMSEIHLASGSFRLIDESYNASPAAVRAALAVLGMTDGGGRRLFALGDMLELGAGAAGEHARLLDAAMQAGVAKIFTAGPLSRHLFDAAPAEMRGAHADRADALARAIAEQVQPSDVVLIKGSAGSRMGDVVTALRNLDQAEMEARRAV
jgi:UDP-N-acetylmuramoyl-tripeptide--D-alanyl-D-alanine ligase